MNERIKELANKAISDVDYIRDDDFTNEELSKMYIPDCFAEKLAELIVRECSLMCLEDKDSQRILQHFGVEE